MNSLLNGKESIDFPLDEILQNFQKYGFEQRTKKNGTKEKNAYIKSINSQVRLFVKPTSGNLSVEAKNAGWQESDDAEVKFIGIDYRGKNLETKGKYVISVRYENPLNEEIPIGPIDYAPRNLLLVKPSIRAQGGEEYLEGMRQRQNQQELINRARKNAKRLKNEKVLKNLGPPPGLANNPEIINWYGGRRTRRTRRIRRTKQRKHLSTRGRF